MSTWKHITSNKNVLSSSDYMSDSLCNALLDYQKVITDNKGQFDSLLTQKETYEAQKVTKDTELINLETQLKVVLNTIDLKQSTGADASAELTQKSTLTTQIDTKKSEIASVITQINTVETQIINLKNTLSLENNLTAAQIIELDDYIIEEEWEDQNYTDDVELYNDALKVFEDLKKPKEIITTNIINIFKLLEGKQDWKKVVIGDKFYIEYERFGIDVETQLIELELDHDGLDIGVTFANTKDIQRGDDKLAKILYNSISTGNRVNMNKYKWDQVNNVKTSVDDILNNKWESAKREITAGVNESVVINERGITITDSEDPNRIVRMTNSVIGLTRDGGNTFKTAISPDGIATETLIGQITITENLYISNQSGDYVFDGNGFTITSKDDGKKRVVLDVDDGLKFQTKVNGVYQDKLYYDSDEDELILKGRLDATEITVGGQSVLTGDKSKISTSAIETLVVGTNVQMGANAYISWDNVQGAPNTTYIDANGIYTGNISANQITTGTINADISTSGWYKFAGGSGIYESSAGNMVLSAGTVTFEGGATIDFSNNPIFGLNINVVFG